MSASLQLALVCQLKELIHRACSNNGFIQKTDVVMKTVNGVNKRKIVVRCSTSPAWLQKMTAVNGGHEDQEIPAYPVGWFTLCQRVATRNQRPETLVEAVQTPPHVNRRTILGNVIDRKVRL